MEKIRPDGDAQQMTYVLSQGNPGAIGIIMKFTDVYEKIDPDSIWKSASPFVQFSENEIFGAHIYYLYNDKCNKNFTTIAMLFRAVQFGYMTKERLQEVAADSTYQINFTDDEISECYDKVCKSLPNFNREIIV